MPPRTHIRRLSSLPSNNKPNLSALYVRGSFFNHSCQPNAVVSWRGATLHVRAARRVAAGEELTIAYTDTYRPGPMRRKVLLSSKGFTCQCTRCAGGPVNGGPIGSGPQGGGEQAGDGSEEAADALVAADLERAEGCLQKVATM